jgi:drug/metabolite transporter (DMT)-like permease
MTAQAVSHDRVVRGIGLTLLGFAVYAVGDAGARWMVAIEHIPATEVVFVYAIASILPISLYFAATNGFADIRPRVPGLTILRGVLASLSGLSMTWALGLLPLADAYAIVFSGPIIVTVLAVPLLGDRIGPWRVGAVLVGFAGVLVMLRPGFTEVGLGHLGAMASTLFFAFSIIVLRRIGRRESDSALIATMIIVTILGTGATLPFVGVMPDLRQLAIMTVVGAIWGFGNVLIVLALRVATPGQVMPFQYSQIIWGLLYGTLLFGDGVDPWNMAGGAIVIASGLFILWRETVRAREQRALAG